jgi:hypothetical protein
VNAKRYQIKFPILEYNAMLQYVDLEGTFAKAYDNAEKEFLQLMEKIEDQNNRMGQNSVTY